MVKINSAWTVAGDTREVAWPIQRSLVIPKYPDSITSFDPGVNKGVSSWLGSVVFSPFRLLGWMFTTAAAFIKNFFCCCFFTDKNSINWDETKDKFSPLYAAVVTSEYGQHHTNRQKNFSQSLKSLSPPALERFCQHIGFVLAARQNITDKVGQIQWYNDNREKIDFFGNYFNNISNNEILKEAVINFDQEIYKNDDC